MSSAQDRGREFEKEFASRMNSKEQPGSGAGKWAKMDVRGKSILWSCKSAPSKRSFSFNRHDFAEVDRAAHGPGGTGDIPGMAVELDGTIYHILRHNDFMELMGSDVTIEGDKAHSKRRQSRVPAALRRED